MTEPTQNSAPAGKRRRRWPWMIVGLVVAFLVLSVIVGIVDPQKKSDSAAPVSSSTTSVPAPTSVARSAPTTTPPAATTTTTVPRAAVVPTSSTTQAPPPASPTCNLTDPTQNPDVIIWERRPNLDDDSLEVGGGCGKAVDTFAATEPSGDGYCSEIAYASDNPGYPVATQPAPRLKNVIQSVGGSCS